MSASQNSDGSFREVPEDLAAEGPISEVRLSVRVDARVDTGGPAKLSIGVVERNPELATRLTVRGVNIRVKV